MRFKEELQEEGKRLYRRNEDKAEAYAETINKFQSQEKFEEAWNYSLRTVRRNYGFRKLDKPLSEYAKNLLIEYAWYGSSVLGELQKVEEEGLSDKFKTTFKAIEHKVYDWRLEAFLKKYGNKKFLFNNKGVEERITPNELYRRFLNKENNFDVSDLTNGINQFRNNYKDYDYSNYSERNHNPKK